MRTDPNNFPPQLKAANEHWNAFVRDHYDFIFAYNERRQQIIADYDGGKGIITKETFDLRLKECYEENLPYSRQFAELWLEVKNADAIFARHANANPKVKNSIPYWAPMIDDTLPGNPGYESSKTKVFATALDGVSRTPDIEHVERHDYNPIV